MRAPARRDEDEREPTTDTAFDYHRTANRVERLVTSTGTREPKARERRVGPIAGVRARLRAFDTFPGMTHRSSNPTSAHDVIDAELDARFRNAYDANGVDRSLIRWNLTQTPTDRVRAVAETLNALATVRRIEPPR